MSKYKCNKCGKVVERESIKKWMMSYCEYTGVKARLYKYPEENTVYEEWVELD